MSFNATQIEALDAPLSRSVVKTRDQGGKTLSYIEGWHAIAEANRIFGFDGWDRKTIRLEETNRDLVTLKARDGASYQQWRVGYLACVCVTVAGVVREGTGFGSGMGKPEALGDAIESAIKEAETDAMKRALMTFGNPFGLALYDKTQENVVAEPSPNALMTAAKAAIDVAETMAELDAWKVNNQGFLANLERQDLVAYNGMVAHWKGRAKIIKARTPPAAKAAFPGSFDDVTDEAAAHLNGRAAA